jgi:hypothetical protein
MPGPATRTIIGVFLLVGCFGSPAMVWAQGGAGSTGTIAGIVSDDTGAVLPGVTVTATSPVQMGVQTAVTDATGGYRFVAVPAGEYALRFELSGFSTVIRDNIRIGVGFTAAVNVKLGVKSIEETVTVSGQSPIIDTSATRVQTNYTRETLESLPNSRDMFSLLSTTPSVVARSDVGGNTVGQQTPYVAYGYTGQNRPMIEGINMSDVTAGNMLIYLDYGSFDDAFISPAGNTAEMPISGILLNFVAKSGGNRFSGSTALDYENESIQSTNLTAQQIQPTAGGAAAFRDSGANRLHSYLNVNADLGGPVVRDRLWFYGSFYRQDNSSRQPPVGTIADGTIFSNVLQNESGKGTFSPTAADKIIGYFQYGVKDQPYRSDSTTLGNPIHQTFESTLNQHSPTWVWKTEYNRTFGKAAFFEVRFGGGGYTIHQTNWTNAPRYEDVGTNIITGGGRDFYTRPRRKQLTAAYSWFLDDLLGGNHNVKFGFERAREHRRITVATAYTNEVNQILRNTAPSAVRLYATPLDSESSMWTTSGFVTDTYQVKRLTLTLGVRFDRYRSDIPAQQHAAGRFFPTPTSYPAVENVITFNELVPRLGGTYDLFGDHQTVLKANFNRFAFNPGILLADAVNPNTSDQWSQYNWTDPNNNRLYDPGEEGALVRRVGGAANASLDPGLANSHASEVSVWVERELMGNMGLRAGYLWKKNYDGYQLVNVLRPFSAYNVPVQVADPGAPGTVLNAFNLDSLARGSQNVLKNINGYEGTYKTFEISLQKRYARRWSLVAAYSHTWTHEFAGTYAGNAIGTVISNPSFAAGNYRDNPNDATENRFTNGTVKLYGTFEPRWAVRFTPVFKYQSGQPYGRIVQAPLNYNAAQPILVEPIGRRRQDDITTLDLRIEKQLPVRPGTRIGLYLDLYNLLNANPALTINWVTGPRFEYPQSVLPPRIARFGVKFNF